MAGLLGLYLEFSHPGSGFAGIEGHLFTACADRILGASSVARLDDEGTQGC
jgi:hypothetical protein